MRNSSGAAALAAMVLAAGVLFAEDFHDLGVRDAQAAGADVPQAGPGKAVKSRSSPAAKPAPAKKVSFKSMEDAARAFSSGDGHLDAMFRSALLDTGKQAAYAEDGTAYIKTGDIPAEWLRDSSAQVRPYLFFAKSDPKVAAFLKAVVERQARSLAQDPYANAFKKDYSVWEEKYELDSLAYPITLVWTYWQVTGDTNVFTSDVAEGLASALATMRQEQDHGSSPRKYEHRELTHNPAGRTGMIWTGFRPSDDACTYNYLIPSEMMAVVALGQLAQIEREVYRDAEKAAAAQRLRQEVHQGIQTFGVTQHPKYGRIYAYETDGLGHFNLMDDANIPSLLAAPFMGYGTAQDQVYKNTRSFLLSADNPYYYSGAKGRGIGSPHTPAGYVWPLALLAQGMTAGSDDEKRQALDQLLASDPGDGRLHESYDPNNPKHFTRPDFGWPNAMLSEFVLTTKSGRPPLPLGSAADLPFP